MAGHRTTILIAALLLTCLVGPRSARAADTPWERFDAALAAVAPRSGFVAAEAVGGRCEPLHRSGADHVLAVASTFKLYVLGELARQVEVGTAAWDEPLAVQDRLKSLPSGGMLYEPAGREFPLRYYAERMIADSDNTATDHLIARLGRESVEAVQAVMGHTTPELNVPFLTTREWFAIKLALTPRQVDAYLVLTDEAQRAFLVEQVGAIDVQAQGWENWVAPKRIDSIEWFASAADLCRALATLQAWSQRPGLEPIASILGLNRGVELSRRTWPMAGCKAGYEAGVYNLSWLLRRADGRWFAVTGGFNDEVNYIDGAAAVEVMRRALRLVARAP